MSIDPMDLIKNQDADAQKWAKAFMQDYNNAEVEIDEALMIAWFSNAIMAMHDSQYWKIIKPLEDELAMYKNSKRFITE